MSETAKFRLRPMEEKDIATVAGFEAEIAKVSFPEDPITDHAFYARKLTQWLDEENGMCVVADLAGDVIGYSHISTRKNFITKEVYADFHSIYISPAGRGTGVSNALVEAIFKFCTDRKLTRCVFRTRATNEPMKAVLARFGFVPTQIYYEKAIEG